MQCLGLCIMLCITGSDVALHTLSRCAGLILVCQVIKTQRCCSISCLLLLRLHDVLFALLFPVLFPRSLSAKLVQVVVAALERRRSSADAFLQAQPSWRCVNPHLRQRHLRVLLVLWLVACLGVAIPCVAEEAVMAGWLAVWVADRHGQIRRLWMQLLAPPVFAVLLVQALLFHQDVHLQVGLLQLNLLSLCPHLFELQCHESIAEFICARFAERAVTGAGTFWSFSLRNAFWWG